MGNGVTAVEASAFDFCENIENVSIPDSIARFEFNNFVYNENLKFNEYKNCLYLGNEQNPLHGFSRRCNERGNEL